MAQVASKRFAYLVLCAVALLTACKPPLSHHFDKQPAQPAAQGEAAASQSDQQIASTTQPDPGNDPANQVVDTKNYTENPTKVVKIGLLVPLSGRSETIGKALQDAGILALFDKYASLSGPAAGVRVELIPKDTKEGTLGIRQAAADAVKEGAQLIIGPLYSQSVEAIKPLAKEGKIPILSFSNNKAVAGDGVYVMGFNPEEQTRRVASFVLSKDDMNRVAVLAPNDPYGRSVTDAIQQTAELLGRKVEPVVNYAPGGVTIAQDVRKLVDEARISGRVNFNALFLPEASELLGTILARFEELQVTPQTVQFLGTGLWDDRDIIRLYKLEGAWLASSPPNMYAAFEERFINSYGYKPPRIASLAYDAVALAATLATSGIGFTHEAITDPSGYSGPANGIFRFHKNGTVERGLAVLQVKHGKFEVMDPAPTAFATADPAHQAVPKK